MVFAFGILIFLWGLFFLPGYILSGLALRALASRRGVDRPWLAWVPGLNLYLLGCLSDQYQAMVRGKTKNKRTGLLLLMLAQLAAFCLMHIAAPSGEEAVSMVRFLLIFVPAWAAAAAAVVLSFMALHDVYVSCDPKNAVLFLILSIVFAVTQPVFLFVCRNKDLGFPL